MEPVSSLSIIKDSRSLVWDFVRLLSQIRGTSSYLLPKLLRRSSFLNNDILPLQPTLPLGSSLSRVQDSITWVESGWTAQGKALEGFPALGTTLESATGIVSELVHNPGEYSCSSCLLDGCKNEESYAREVVQTRTADLEWQLPVQRDCRCYVVK